MYYYITTETKIHDISNGHQNSFKNYTIKITAILKIKKVISVYWKTICGQKFWQFAELRILCIFVDTFANNQNFKSSQETNFRRSPFADGQILKIFYRLSHNIN